MNGLNFNLQLFAGVVHGDAGGETIKDVASKTQAYGLAGDDTITSNGSKDVFLIGGSGNDVLQMTGGSGTLNGGSGADSFELTYSKSNPLSVVIEDINPTHDRLTINYTGTDGTPTLNYSTIGQDLVVTDGDYLNVTLKGYREVNDYCDEFVSDKIWEVLRIVNNERESNGLTWLTLSQGLTDAAQLRSTELPINFSHTRPNGSSCFTALQKSYSYTGENAAEGQKTSAQVMDGWMHSPGHRANILNSNYRKLGVGYTYTPSGSYNHYWIQMFAGSLDATESLSTSQILSTPLTLYVNNSAQSNSTLGDVASLKFTTINGTAGNDIIDVESNNVVVDGGAGDDLIINGRWASSVEIGKPAQYTTLNGGDGNDTITSSGSYSVLEGGAGNDLIYNGYYFYEPWGGTGFLTENNTSRSGVSDENKSSYVTITGGAGDDTIHLNSGSGHNVITYSNGDGNDIVYGLSSDDTIQIDGTYSTLSSGGSVIVSVGDGQITLYGANTNSLNITGNYAGNDTIGNDTTGDDTTGNDNAGNDTTGNDNAGDDSIGGDNTGGVDTTETIVHKTVYDYRGGYFIVQDYKEGDQINLASDFKGIGFDDKNFFVHSSSGMLEVENVRGKAVDYGDAAGNLIARSFMASGVGTVDYRDNSQFQVLIGANSYSNRIYAGSGGSNMWGGIGGNDTLIGGDGYDEFFFTLGSGYDIIKNAGDNDVINLLGVSIGDFTGVNVRESGVSATFSDGSSLRVDGNSRVGYKLGDMVFAVNQSTNEWYVK